MDQESGIAGNPLVARAKSMVLTPRDEWPKIASESQTPGEIFTRYVIPLAAMGPTASLIGGQVFGCDASGFRFHPSLVAALGTAVITFVLTLACVLILTVIAEVLAPKFGGEANRAQAFKLVAYASTAWWLAGLFGLIPFLGFFTLLGLYSIYLYYTGAGQMMKVPNEKRAGYRVVVIICAVSLTIAVSPMTTAVAGLFFAPGIYCGGDANGKINMPGGSTLGVDKAEEFGRRMEDAATGNIMPVPVAQLQTLLPGSIGAYQRTATETAGMGDVGGQASATYEASPHRFTLKIVDMSAPDAPARMGTALGVEQSREDADSYERTQTIDGQIRTEAWNKTNNNGKYGVVIGNRFVVEAEGGANSVDELKAAVATIDPDDLQDLAE